MLRCTSIRKNFGGVMALADVDLHIGRGEVVGLIGPNGSGKSTLVNVLSGFITPDAGHVELDGEDITGLEPSSVRRRHLVRTFQNLRLFSRLSVLDNMLVALHLMFTGDRAFYFQWLGAMAGRPRARRTERESRERAMEALRAVELDGKANELVMNLSYGDQKRLELARATVLAPKALLLDEPTAGLAPQEAAELMDLFISNIARDGDRCLLLIEHRLELVLGICDRVAVLDSGVKIAEGTPAEISANEEVLRVYVGDEGD